MLTGMDSPETGSAAASPEDRGCPWWLWLLIVLFPIPFSPWWLTVTCLAVFCALLWIILAGTPRQDLRS